MHSRSSFEPQTTLKFNNWCICLYTVTTHRWKGHRTSKTSTPMFKLPLIYIYILKLKYSNGFRNCQHAFMGFPFPSSLQIIRCLGWICISPVFKNRHIRVRTIGLRRRLCVWSYWHKSASRNIFFSRHLNFRSNLSIKILYPVTLLNLQISNSLFKPVIFPWKSLGDSKILREWNTTPSLIVVFILQISIFQEQPFHFFSAGCLLVYLINFSFYLP